MKDKLSGLMQTFSRAIIQPVMFMAVTGILIALAAIFRLESMPKSLKTIGDLFFTVLQNGIIGQLSLIFCVGIAAAIAKKHKTDAAILGVSVYLIFLYWACGRFSGLSTSGGLALTVFLRALSS